jgi:hypothetical protein
MAPTREIRWGILATGAISVTLCVLDYLVRLTLSAYDTLQRKRLAT